jgi:hypothetical protein
MDAAARVMRDPKDVLLVDLDDQGKWKILSKDEVDRISRRYKEPCFGTSFC